MQSGAEASAGDDREAGRGATRAAGRGRLRQEHCQGEEGGWSSTRCPAHAGPAGRRRRRAHHGPCHTHAAVLCGSDDNSDRMVGRTPGRWRPGRLRRLALRPPRRLPPRCPQPSGPATIRPQPGASLPRFPGCAVSAPMRLTASWAPARRPVHSGRRQRLPVRVRRRLLRAARECLPAPHASPGTWLRSLPPPPAAAPPPPLRFSALGSRALDCSTLNVRVADSAGSAPSASPSTGTSFGRVGALLTWAFQQQRADPLGFDSGRASCADADECASRPCQHGITSHGRHGHSRN